MGSQVCQLCGKVGLYRGQWNHMQTHPTVAGRSEFICLCCLGTAGAKALEQQPFRFCEFCPGRLDIREANRIEGVWACPSCRERVKNGGWRETWDNARDTDESAAIAFLIDARSNAACGVSAEQSYSDAARAIRTLVESGRTDWCDKLAEAEFGRRHRRGWGGHTFVR